MIDALTKVKEKYEAGWGAYLQVAQRAAQEEGQNLARILNRCMFARGEFAKKRWKRYLPQMGGMNLSPRVPNVSQLAYYTSVVVEILRQYMSADTDQVVEMGSGWSAITSSLWLSGGPRDAKYFALEYTENGRAVSQILAQSEPRFHLNSHYFDYYDADFSNLDQQAKKTVVYSIFSIEQITELPDTLIERMLAIPGFHRAVHIEPVGWQFHRHTLPGRFDQLLQKLGIPALSRQASASRRCRKMGFNRNLVDLLKRFEAAGRIVIEKTDIDIVGHHPGNPGTLIVWRKA